MDRETLEYYLTEYKKAKADHKELYDNPPVSDQNGRWPHWYVGNIERAEKEAQQWLARLGSFVVEYQNQFLEIVPTEDDLLEMEEGN